MNLDNIIDRVMKDLKTDLISTNNTEFNRYSLLEIDTLDWILEIKRNINNDLYTLKKIVENRINDLNTKFIAKYTVDSPRILKIIEILKTCLFLINRELELKEQNSNILCRFKNE